MPTVMPNLLCVKRLLQLKCGANFCQAVNCSVSKTGLKLEEDLLMSSVS